MLLPFIVACTTHRQTVQVPVELPSIQYCYIDRSNNSVVLDSVSRWNEGDTVYIYREKTRILNTSDVYISKDSIPTAVRLETIDELNVDYLNKLGDLKSLIFKILSP